MCDICGNIFGRKDVYRNHIRIVHEKIKEWKCESCDKYFSKKMGINKTQKAISRKQVI